MGWLSRTLVLGLAVQASTYAQYTISVAAGTGRVGVPGAGDNGPATSADMDPRGIAVDGAGNLYIADNTGGRIRKVTPAGIITSVAGGGMNTPANGQRANTIGMGNLDGLAADSAGDVFINNDGGFQLVKVAPSGLVSIVTSSFPAGELAVDRAGNVYVSDNFAQVVKVNPAGMLSTVAGTGSVGYGGDNGLAVNANLNPRGMAIDGAGNVYIADRGNHVIRKVSPSGIITTVAGTPKTGGYLGDGGPAVNAQLFFPSAVAVDSAGNLFIADSYNNVIRMVDTTGTITTIAGTGTGGESGDGGPALSARLSSPTWLALDSSGKLYINDDGRIRVLTPPRPAMPATITSLNPPSVVAGGSDFTLTLNGANFQNGAIVEWNGSPLPTTFVSATQITAQVSATLVATPGNAGIMVVNPGTAASNNVNFVSSGPLQPATSGQYTISVAAGTGRTSTPGAGDNGPATSADMDPRGIAVDGAGNLYIADNTGGRIRKVTPAGIITSVAGGGMNTPANGQRANTIGMGNLDGLAADSAGDVFINNDAGFQVVKVAPSGLVSIVTSSFPAGELAVDRAGNVYVSDNFAQVVKVNPAGMLSTVAGTGSVGYGGDNGPAVNANVNPRGIAVDGAGNVYIADRGNHVIRKVSPSGIITTVAGTPKTGGYLGDGGPAVNAQLFFPSAVAVDSAGDLFIADSYNNVIRMVDTTGTITTIAGTGTGGESGDGGPALSARLSSPTWLALDSSGKLYINDDSRIRVLTPAQPPPPPSPPPSITSLSPPGATSGGPAFTLTVNGSNFQNGAVVDWNGSPLSTTFVSATQLTAQVLSSLIASAGNASITVVNPDSGTSGGVTFSVTTQAPCSPTGLLIQIISPASGFAAQLGQPLNIEVEVADNCGIVPSGAVQASFSNGDPGIQLIAIGQGNYAASWTPRNAALNVVMTVIAFETLGPGRILNAQVAISGTLQSAQPARLSTSVPSLSFSQTGGGASTSLPLTVSSQGSGTSSFSVQTSTQTGGPWLSTDPTSGTVSAGSPATVNVTVNPGTLLPGTYSGTVTILSGSQSIPVGVTMTISSAQGILLLSLTALSFTAVQGGGAPLAQDFGVLNIGQGTMSWTATATVRSNTANWLTLSATSGTVTRPFLDVSLVNAGVNPTGLTAGTYYGQITVSAPGVDNSPQSISVVLTVLPPGSNPGPDVRPSGIIFVGPTGQNPPAQTVQISNTSPKPSLYGSNTVTLPGVPAWFANTPAGTTIMPGQPLAMMIKPDFSHLTAGATRGQVSLLFDDGSSRTIALLAVVPPAGTSSSSRQHTAAGCTASQLHLQPTGAPLPLNAAVGQPATVDILIVDDCGQPVVSSTAGAAATVAFSNGDPSGPMVSMGNGRWMKTWQPQKPIAAGAPAAATVTAFLIASNGKVLANQIDIPVVFGNPTKVPFVNSGGVLNAASLAGAVPVAPGSLITIQGANLAEGMAAQSATAPLPMQLGQTNVLLAGRPLPLLYASDNQINAQVPFDIPVNIPSQLIVQSGDTVSVPEPLTLAPAQPAVFTADASGQGQGSIYNFSTGQLADPTAPVTAGDSIQIFCTGLGAVMIPIDNGAAATDQDPVVQDVTLTIGGQTASISYAGLSPGAAGVYQIQATVPDGITPGDQVQVTVTTAGQTSPPVTMAVR